MDALDPRHGTYAGYQAHYRAGEPQCGPCRLAGKRMNIIKEQRRERGIKMLIPLGVDAWKILHESPRPQVAAALGIKQPRISTLITRGPDGLVHRSTQQRILALAAEPFVTPIGVRRRLQALAALGWSARYIAEHYDGDMSSLKIVRAGKHRGTLTRTRTRDVVMRAWVDLHMTRRPDSRSATTQRRLAERNGWLPPFTWDRIDDPNEIPAGRRYQEHRRRDEVDEAVVLRVLAGDRLPMTAAERVEVVRRARASGWTEAHTEAVTGIAKATSKSRYKGAAA